MSEKKEAKTLKQKISNIFYYYKWYIIIGIIVLAFGGVLIHDFVTADRYDANVVFVHGGYIDSEAIPTVAEELQKYCPDINGDGKVLVYVNNLYIQNGVGAEDYDAEHGQERMAAQLMLDTEVKMDKSFIYIYDNYFINHFNNRVCAPLEEKNGLTVVNGYAYDITNHAVAQTQAGKELFQKSDKLYISFKKELSKQSEKSAEAMENAREFFENITADNKVN